jgi:hypothetical protein
MNKTVIGIDRLLLAVLLCFAADVLPGRAQPFAITSTTLSNGVQQLGFPGRSDSYYLLQSSSSLTLTSRPVAALLEAGTNQMFQGALSGASEFFRVEQLPLTATNDLIGDGISDGFSPAQR